MKQTTKTDFYINVLNGTFSVINPIYNADSYIDVDIATYILELNGIYLELKSLNTDEIRAEFWSTIDDFISIKQLRRVYEVRFDRLLMWKKEFGNYKMLDWSYSLDIKAFIDKHKLQKVEFTELEEKMIYRQYVRISHKLISLRTELKFYLKEWEDMSITGHNEIKKENLIEEPSKNKDFTTKRQVLAMYYLLNEVGCKIGSVDRTVQARFIEFMSGKNYDNIYSALEEPHKGLDKTNNKIALKDMDYVKQHFEKLGLNDIVNKISVDSK